METGCIVSEQHGDRVSRGKQIRELCVVQNGPPWWASRAALQWPSLRRDTRPQPGLVAVLLGLREKSEPRPQLRLFAVLLSQRGTTDACGPLPRRVAVLLSLRGKIEVRLQPRLVAVLLSQRGTMDARLQTSG